MRKTEDRFILTRLGDLVIRTVVEKHGFEGGDVSPEIHAHAYYELLISMEGEMCVELDDGARILLQCNDICLIPPNRFHCTHRATVAPKMLGIRFFYQQGDEEAHPALYRRLSADSCVRIIPKQPKLSELIGEISRELHSAELGASHCVEALMTQLYVHLIRLLMDVEKESEPLSAVGDERNTRRRFVEEYFFQNYALPISEEHLARQMNLSVRQVNRVLRQIYGKGFRAILTEMRVRHAAQLLCQSDRSIEEIAYAVGYTSLSGFYSAFSRQFGVSAGKYRHQALKS